MAKVKVTLIQKQALDLITPGLKKKVIEKHLKRDGLYQIFQEIGYTKTIDYTRFGDTLYKMPFDDFIKALYIGYELELPKPVTYKTAKAEICFNYNVDNMINNLSNVHLHNTIYSRIYANTSIEEAREIAKALNDLCDYYEKYIQKS